MNAPHISEELVKWLEGLFPDKIPTQPVDVGDFSLLVGQQQVIRKLRHEMKIQQNNPLER